MTPPCCVRLGQQRDIACWAAWFTCTALAGGQCQPACCLHAHCELDITCLACQYAGFRFSAKQAMRLPASCMCSAPQPPRSVKHSLEQLAAWRATHSMHRAGMRPGIWGSSHLSWFDFRDFLFGSKQDKVLFKARRGLIQLLSRAPDMHHVLAVRELVARPKRLRLGILLTASSVCTLPAHDHPQGTHCVPKLGWT